MEKAKKNFDFNLEALRGFAALMVIFHHVIGSFDTWLDPNFKPANIRIFEPSGHLSVLIFFVLSGYVIGISHKERLTTATIRTYLKKRFVRLYPIYLACIIITLIVANQIYPVSTIFGHLTFTQVLLTPVFAQNPALWSLHYEVLFYLLFIPVSFFNINPVLVACLSFVIGVINSFLYPYLHTPIITSYMYGFTFWVCGLIIARNFSKKAKEVNYSLLLSCIFLILSFGEGTYNVLVRVMDKANILFHNQLMFPITDWYKPTITWNDFSLLPYCFMFIIIFTGKEFKYKKLIITCLQLLPVFAIAHIIKSNLSLQDVLVPTVYYVLSLILYFFHVTAIEPIIKKILSFGIWAGSLSYGLYIIHLPILFAFKRISLFSGSSATYIVRLILFLIITFFVAWLLEKKLQKRVKGMFSAVEPKKDSFNAQKDLLAKNY